MHEEIARSGIRRDVRIVRSAAAGAPVTWGWLRPIILLPNDAEEWPVDRTRAVLVHELAHIARHDYLAQIVAGIACALYWFHPLAWIAARRLRAESEHACDDRVLSTGTPSAEYASHLLDVAREARALRLGGFVAVSMARTSHLEARLQAVLDEERSRRATSLWWRALATVVIALALVPLAGLRPELRGAPLADRAQISTLPVVSVDEDASVDSTFDRSIQAAPGERLVLALETGASVVMRGSDEQRVHLRARLAGANWRETRVEMNRDGRDVRIGTDYDTQSQTTSSRHSFEITVPRRFDLRIESAGGSLTILDVEGTFRGAIGGGSIILRGVRGTASLSTGGGDVEVSDANLTGSVSTGGGAVNFTRVTGPIRGGSGSGPVMFRETKERTLTNRTEDARGAAEQERRRRVTLDYQDADIRNVAEDIGRFAGRTIVVAPNVRATDITARIKDEPWDAALASIVRSVGLSMSEDSSGVITIERRTSDDLRDLTIAEPKVRIDRSRESDAGMLHIQKAGGDIILGAVPNGVSVTTGGGRIHIGRGAGVVEASTGGGNIEIGPIAGSVSAGTGAGDVHVYVESARGEQTVTIQSGAGRAIVELPRDLDARIDLETAYTRSFGRATRIESPWELERQETTAWDDREGTPRRYVRGRAIIGSGRGLVHIRVVNGDIELRRR